MRILKRQEILPDYSTLIQHNISDGVTVNIVIEPSKQITVDVICKWGIFKHEITSSFIVRDLKQKLIDSEQVGFSSDGFVFEVKLPEGGTKILDDDALPLQHYGIQDDCKVTVVRPYLFLTLMNELQSEKVHRKIPMKTAVRKLKKMIMQLFCDKNVTDIYLFVTNNEIDFVTVDPNADVPVPEILSDGQTVCYLENKYDFHTCYPVEHGYRKICWVYGVLGDTVGTIKLRIQNQLGIPAGCVAVTKSERKYCSVFNKYRCVSFDTSDDEMIDELEITITTWGNSQLPIARPYLFLTLMSQDHSKKKYKKVLKNLTVKELEVMVLKLFCDQNVSDISLFVTSDQIKYVKVDPSKDVSVGEILSDDQTICYLEDKCEYKNSWWAKKGDVGIGRVYGDENDTAEVVKLRVQDQLGIPANHVSVKSREIHIDDSLSLHHYGMEDDGKFRVDKPFIFLAFMSKDQPEKLFRKVSKNTTVGEIKSMVVELFCKDTNDSDDISLFATEDEAKYLKVCAKKDVSVGEILSGDETICYLEDKCDYKEFWPVKRGKQEIGKVYGDKGDTVRTVKLRVQDQLGILVSRISVTRREISVIGREDQYFGYIEEPVYVDVPLLDDEHMVSEFSTTVMMC